MADETGDVDFAHLRREQDQLSERLHQAVRADPDHGRAYRRAERLRAWHQGEVGRYADDKEDILLAASEKRGQGPAALAELAGGVSRQLTSRMIGNARARRGSEPGEGTTA